MNKWLFHQNGFTRTSLSATVTRTNYWSRSANSLLEENFFPCGKFIGSEFQTFSSSEEEIILPASERRMRADGTLAEIYKLTYTEGARSTSAKIQLNFYTPEKEIPKPKIQLPKRRKYIATQTRVIKIKARCKSVTGYIWTSTKGQQKLDIALVAKHADQISVKHNSNHHNSEKFDRCDLLLDFGQLDDAAARRILNGQNYKLTISAISEMHVVSETVTLFSYKHPEIKYFSIKSSEDSYRASETNFYVILSGLRDPAADKSTSTRLKCLYYSKQVSSHTHEQINSRFVSSDKRMKFTLQAGTYSEFKARCCSYVSGQCTTVFASDITQFTVQPVDIREEDTSLMVVQQMQMAMQMAVEIALKTVMYALLMVQEALRSSPSTPPVQQVQIEVNVKISVAIEAVLPEEDEESDVDDTRAVLKESAQLLKQHNDPQNVPKSTKSSVLRVTVETCVHFTGFNYFGGYSRRRRRETTVTDQEDGEGMSAEVATEMLNSIGATFGSSTDGADKTMADLALATVKQVMVGFCQSYSEDDSSPLDAFDDIVSVRVVKKSMAGTASSQSEMVSNSKTTPAAATYGTDIESHYGQPWECKNDTSSCTDVCLAVAQVVIDFITLTATMEKTPPILHSDIILIELINPETNVEEEVTNLADPVVVTVPTRVADLTNFDLVCMMWIDDDWDDTKCTMGIPFMTGRGQFDVTCSCSELGILGVFQTEKSNTSVFIATTSTTTSQQKPSKNLLSTTVAAKCELIIQAIWETETGKATEVELINHFKNELVTKTGYPLESFTNVAIRKGSIILSFELQPSTTAGSDTLGQMLASIELLVDSGTMTITNPSGDTLTINANSFTYTEQSSEDGGSVTSASVGAIVGGVIGGIAFIALAAGAAFFVFKKTNLGKSFRPNSPAHVSPHTPDINARSIYHLPPPPSYNSLAPEKQKLYPDTKKWTENELKPWHPNEKYPRFVGNATSLEQGLVPDPEERTPTPVGN